MLLLTLSQFLHGLVLSDKTYVKEPDNINYLRMSCEKFDEIFVGLSPVYQSKA